MKVIYISDMDLKGTGYMNIAAPLCTELVATYGHDVTVLGIGYKGEEHNFPFRVIPVLRNDFYAHLHAMVHNINVDKDKADVLVVALDIPMQIALLDELEKYDIPYVGIFPVEAPPLIAQWAMSISRMKYRLSMSKFGLTELEKFHLPSAYIPIGLDTESWRVPGTEEKANLRKALGIPKDAKIVLTVADNQERKNLSSTLEIINQVREKENIIHFLVTRKRTGVGWEIDDLIAELGMTATVQVFERGMPFKRLWSLYAAADAFLITSKAEGLGMPVLEAMACGVPVVAPNHTAFTEHLSDGRGFLFDVAFKCRDPFGNEFRYFGDTAKGVESVLAALDDGVVTTKKALEYVKERTWKKAAEVLNESLV